MKHPAEEFLERLDPSASKFLFVTFDDVASRKNYNLTTTKYGAFAQFKDLFDDLNREGAGIFVTVNKTKGNRRKLDDVIEGRAIWQEDDNGTQQMPGLRPHIVIESSPKRYHRYWLTSQEDRQKWEMAQVQMVRHYGSDPGAKDWSRVLRLPGYKNHKHLDENGVGAEVKLLAVANDSPYPWEKIEEMLGIAASDTDTPSKVGQQGQQDTGQRDTDTDTGTDTDAEPSTLQKYLDDIMRGEHLHTPIRAIMMLNANKGLDREYNKLQLTGLIALCPDEDRRRKATADLDAMLNATYKKLEDEQEPSIELIIPKSKNSPVPEAPGYLGELVECAYEYAPYPNRMVATVSAMGLIAGIVGRRYNVSKTGLNLYISLIMDTGAGKDAIVSWISEILKDRHLLGTTGTSFFGAGRHTGPRSLWNSLAESPSQLQILTEAGLLYKSDAGDQTGLLRVILSLYGRSGAQSMMPPESYSAAEHSLPMLFSPALSFINEATGVTLKAELAKRESIDTGELPRMWVFDVTGKKPYINRDHGLRLDRFPNVGHRLKDLLHDCYQVQSNQPPDIRTVVEPNEFYDFEHYCIDQENHYKEEDPNKATMYSRSPLKVLKLSAISAVFNDRQITKADWEWAIAMHEIEQVTVGQLIHSDDTMQQVMMDSARAIIKVLKGELKSKSARVPKELTERGIFTESAFKTATYTKPSIRGIGRSPKYGSPKSGGAIALEYLIQEGYVAKVNNPKRFLREQRGRLSTCYRVTTDFNNFITMHDV